MIRNLAIVGAVALLFMSGGFYFGLKLVHVPAPKKPAAMAAAKAPATPAVARDVISINALKKTSENMEDMNQALQVREQAVAAREKKARQVEDELAAERAALDRSHAKFHELYGQFQQRLQLVSASENDQLQRQMAIYTAMDPAQAADLMRSLNDGTIVRLFSMMETKPLAKLVAAWKTKYPADSTRVLTALTTMGRVMPEDKIALADSTLPAEATANAASADVPATDAASDSGNGAVPTAKDGSDSSASSTPAPDTSSAPATDSAPAAISGKDPDVGLPDASASNTDAPSNAADSTPSDTPAPAVPASATTGGARVHLSAPSGGAPAPAAQPIYSTPNASTSLAPPPEPSNSSHASNSTGNGPDSPSLLGIPGETAARADAIARNGRLSADASTDRSY